MGQARQVAALPLLALLAAAAPAPAPHGMEHGLWAGSVRLCGADTARVREASGGGSDELALLLSFPDSIQPALERETTRLLKRRMPIRLDGVTLVSPFVNEPIRGSGLTIIGQPLSVLERIRSAALAPCGTAAVPGPKSRVTGGHAKISRKSS